MIDILIDDSLEIADFSEELENVGLSVLHTLQPELDCDLTIAITTDDEIQHLNSQFRGIDLPTDVLSFSSDELDPASGVRYLGDIVISFNRASIQAASAGHPVLDELKLLVIHGILHLLGYDHDTPETKSKMWAIQDQLLEQNQVHLNKISGDDENE